MPRKMRIYITSSRAIPTRANSCPGCDGLFSWHEDSKTGESARPSEGDCGVCARCGAWWELKRGEYCRYKPTEAEIRQVWKYAKKNSNSH